MGNGVELQRQYFREFTQLKENCIYFNSYVAKDNGIEYVKNIILAIGSSSAIGAWAIWKECPMVWAAIIAGTQVVQAVSPLLPYKKRIELCAKIACELDGLCIQAESEWYEISSGKKRKDEINDMYIKLKTRKKKIIDNILKGQIIPESKKLVIRSKAEREIYFKNQYPKEAACPPNP
jgi:hypothetical protein